VILGGPALYLVGNALFKWALWHHVPPVRFVAIVLLAALVPVAFVASRLVLLSGATLVLLVVALWDIRSEHQEAWLPPATP
jgi:low temperature requirement protein LtrA